MSKRFVVVDKEGSPLGSGLKLVLVDMETGVNYLFMQSGYAGGLTPLLDKTGKPVISAIGTSSAEAAEND